LALSVVIAANILVAVIALSRAYREERRPRPRRFSGFASGWGHPLAMQGAGRSRLGSLQIPRRARRWSWR